MSPDEVEYNHCPVDNTLIYDNDRFDNRHAYCSQECFDIHHDETKSEVLAKVSLKTGIPAEALDLECEEIPWDFEESTWRVYRIDLDRKDEGGYWKVETWPEKIEFVSCIKSIEEVA